MSSLKGKIEKAKITAYQCEVLLRASSDADSEEDECELFEMAFIKTIELRKYLTELMNDIGGAE